MPGLEAFRLTGRLEALDPKGLQALQQLSDTRLVEVAREAGPIHTLQQWRIGYRLRQQLLERQQGREWFDDVVEPLEEQLFGFCRRRARDRLSPGLRPVAKYTLWHRYYPSADNTLIVRVLAHENLLRIDARGRAVVLGFHLALGTASYDYDAHGQEYRRYARRFRPQAFVIGERFQKALQRTKVELEELDEDVFAVHETGSDRRGRAEIAMSRDDKLLIQREFLR